MVQKLGRFCLETGCLSHSLDLSKIGGDLPDVLASILVQSGGSEIVILRNPALGKQVFQHAFIHARELIQGLDIDAFVDLVNSGVDGAQLDDLRTGWRDKTPI